MVLFVFLAVDVSVSCNYNYPNQAQFSWNLYILEDLLECYMIPLVTWSTIFPTQCEFDDILVTNHRTIRIRQNRSSATYYQCNEMAFTRSVIHSNKLNNRQLT